MSEHLILDSMPSLYGSLVILGHVALFLLIVRLASVSIQAYRDQGNELQRYLSVAFLLMILGISGDDLFRELGVSGRIPSEVIELVPLLLAFTLLHYGLFYRD